MTETIEAVRPTVADSVREMPAQPEPTATAPKPGEFELSDRMERAEAVMRIGMGWSSGAALVPVPGLDLVAMLAVQVRMLKLIADIYGVPFRREVVRPLLAALISSGGAYALASPAASLLKLVPVVGMLASAVATPSLSVASCYATGRVFIRHFESGGTFLDFDPRKARAYYKQEMKAAARRQPAAATA